ncbi:protein ITPRID2 [Conger conger]|uniref:protein ITPRID2 n=1 Tax=Conger conger TaxID=82655 RepID=UPI002A5A3F8E|nr:protein ITPRID2 [Conger conger]XP_061091306.1 protein ITPRID2 [Conger conger]
MEECGSTGRAHPWKAATMKRKAWALSRGSWQASESQDGHPEGQASESQDGHTEGQPSPQPAPDKVPAAEEPGRIPNKIASWLKECRTPLGASLDEQSNTPTKGTVKHACSFEDDLSLGAEANHLRAGGTPSEIQRLGMLAQEKRTQFKQKGRSMNSTGSGKSNTTVSSVSELLDLYEEDPEEILYNLGFGREEPDIASKIPSRFFNSTSHARGIDIKVYLGAQLQRLELENPNYALTSRFRQIEVLTTVANAFSSLYSQVSGTPVQKIGSCDIENKEAATVNRNTSALNAAKILKKTVTRRNLHAAVDGHPSARPEAEGPGESDHEQPAKTKDHPSLATVAEAEESQGVPNGDLPNGIKAEVDDEQDFTPAKDSSLSADPDSDQGKDQAVTSTPAKEPPTNRLHTCITHLLSQARDSFEMEEVQSNEGEGPAGISSSLKHGNELLMRMASQHSDSSGFAEDPSTDSSASHLKVQESSDSCDSETTVTSNAGELGTPLALDHPAFQKLQGEEDGLTAIGSDSPVSLDQPTFQKLPGEEEGLAASCTDSTVALDQPAFQKLPGEEDGLTAIGSEGAVALDQPAFQKLPGEEEGLAAIGSDSAVALDQPTFQKLPGEEEGLTVIGSDGSLTMDEPAFHNLEGEEEVQTAGGQDSTGELNAGLQSGNQSNGEEEVGVVQEEVVKEVVEDKVVEEIVEEEVEEEAVISKYLPHQRPQSTEREILTHTSNELSSSEGLGSPAEPEAPSQISSVVEPDSEDTQDHMTPPAAPACEEQGAPVWARVRELQQGRDRYPLRRSSSLPISLISPSRVVSSIKIHFRPGSARHCTPPSFSYRYTPDDEGEDGTGSIAEQEEEEEVEEQAPCRSTLIINTGRDVPEELQTEDVPPSRMPPYPLHLPAHLTRSSCSLHSTPLDWSDRPVCDLPRSWSTCSMPALPAQSAPYGSPLGQPRSTPYNSTFGHPHTAPYSLPLGQPHSAPYSLPLGQPHSAPDSLPLGHPHNASYSSLLGHPHSAPYSLPPGQPHSAPYSLPPGQPHSAPDSLPLGHPHSAPYSLLLGQPHSASYSSPLGHPHNASYSSLPGQPHSAPYSSLPGHLRSAPYSVPPGHPRSASYSFPLGHPQSASYSSPLGHSNSASCSSFFNQPHSALYGPPLDHPHSAPYHYGVPQNDRWNGPFNPLYSSPCPSNCCPSFPATNSRLSQPPSGVEMQLKRVLHDVRGAVQNLAQGSSLPGEDTVTAQFSSHRAVQPLFEDTIQELQLIKRNLNVFRTQMMDLELALLRQQDMVYQHLTEEDRQEAEHLQSLRTAVRQELHELELQLEDRLLFLDEQFRASPYRHPVGLSRGHSLDSRCSSPSMNVTEPVTELLREQLSLQAELGLEGKARSAPLLASSCSSGSASPVRPSRPLGHPEVYRTSVCLTPAMPPRQQMPGAPQSTHSMPTRSLPEDGGGVGATAEGGAVENPQLQELISEIKRSITDEIRQEIMSDLLAAVLPRSSPAATQDHTL